MKHTIRKICAVFVTVILLLTANSFGLFAYATGTGTAENPYQITTAAELQAINDNPAAHYILMADIDLQSADFTPIGNADSGAFSGSFDGNGFTISNLNVFSGKYAGLFGCNEGIIKNVTLSDIYVYGTRYIGGVVGENTALGSVADCKVLGGTVTSDGGINNTHIGGICGSNNGTFVGAFCNGANLTASNSNAYAYTGGIIGWTGVVVNLTAENTGKITSNSSYSRSGGLIGYASGNVTILNSHNTGSIYDSNNIFPNSGGLIGQTDGSVTITNSYNMGNVSSRYYAGGFVGDAEHTVTITNAYNTGNVYGAYRSGGLVGQAPSYDNLTITNSYNTGNISSSERTPESGGLVGSAYKGGVTITNCYNTGNVSASYSGGLIGYSDYGTIIITGCFNTGSIYGSSHSSGGLVGYGRGTITNCYNTGNIITSHYQDTYSGGLIGRSYNTDIIHSYNTGNIIPVSSSTYSGELAGNISVDDTYNYSLNSAYLSGTITKGCSGTRATSAQMQDATTYIDWDFCETWAMGGSQNSGYPVLQAAKSPLQLNIANAICLNDETLQLFAYKNGEQTNSVTWSVTNGSATVNSNGKVVALDVGPATITATDANGNKANCNIYIMEKNNGVALNSFSLNQGASSTRSVELGVESSGDYLVSVASNDPSIIQVTNFGGKQIVFVAKSTGTATISFETAQGFKGTCTATVTNYATSIDIPTSLTVPRGNTAKLTATISPLPTSSTVSWVTSNPNIATVDQNGNVTGVALGEVAITAKTDNGRSDTCTVTVDAPCKDITFTETNIIMAKGSMHQLSVLTDPVDTTSSVSYSCSSSSSYLSVSSSGLVTAKSTGTYTVYATANGIKASCTVRVVDAIVEAATVSLCDTNKSVLLGDTFNLQAQITPANATDKTLTYTSDDASVASVDESGNVTALSPGTTLLRATAVNGVSAVCMLTVRNVAEENGLRYFDIYTPQDLTLFSEYVNTKDGYDTLNARLHADLNMSAEYSESDGISFAPIGSLTTPYRGCFEGNGFTVHNLYVSANDYAGLFGYLSADATVQNLTLENANIIGDNYVGGVAGKSEGTMQAVSVSGSITGNNMYVGGITGYNAGGTIDRCINTASLIGIYIVGGIAGYSRNVENPGAISNSYSAADILCFDYRVGGICGVNDDTVQNCFFDTTLFDGAPIGFGANTSLSDSAKTTAQFQSGAVAYALNTGAGKTVFYQTIGTDDAPTLENTHGVVYYGYGKCGGRHLIYDNTPLSDSPLFHQFIDGVCAVCGTEKSIVIVDANSHAEGLPVGRNTVDFCRAELENNAMYIEVKDYNGNILSDTDLVGTGATISYYDSETNAIIKTVTVVLYGDVNGDGTIGLVDKDEVMLQAIGAATLDSIWFSMAADTNRDGAIDAFDATQIGLQYTNSFAIIQK